MRQPENWENMNIICRQYTNLIHWSVPEISFIQLKFIFSTPLISLGRKSTFVQDKTRIILLKRYEQRLFYSTKQMFLHGFLIKQYNPMEFMILWKPVKGCLHTCYAAWTKVIYHCNGNCMINNTF